MTPNGVMFLSLHAIEASAQANVARPKGCCGANDAD